MSRDTSFYYSFLVLPPRKRRAIVAVWDFCRAVDDSVDVGLVPRDRMAREDHRVARPNLDELRVPAGEQRQRRHRFTLQIGRAHV